MKMTFQKLLLLVFIITLISCGDNTNNDHRDVTLQDSIVSKMDSIPQEQTVFYNLPSPVETFMAFKMAGANFDKSLLNQVDKISNYSSSASKAINLGVYSTDLSYSFMYKQNQETNLYLKNISELTTALGIDGSYGQDVYKRMRANEKNIDSLMQIFSEASVNTDLYLKENQRNNTVVLIAVGAWVESVHILANTADKTQKEGIIELVADQRVAIKPLLKMLEQHQSDAAVASVIEDIQGLASIYGSLAAKEIAPSAVLKDKEITNVGNNQSYTLSKDQLKAILEKTEAIRNKFTN